MEIIILLSLLFIVCRLGGTNFHAGRIYLFDLFQFESYSIIKDNYQIVLNECAVKPVQRDSYLLNSVVLFDVQKTTQTTLIQLRNLKLEG
ncbi:hypothetical protein [Falsiporphyromonas endometrii]|uniref:Uncharacterized protein n=1 Tax=Falsiporphyromonas endometrii TaxID=1387297 RepID=A0ABV9KA58_9PORP